MADQIKRTGIVTPNMYKQVSEYRRGMLHNEIEQGTMSEGRQPLNTDAINSLSQFRQSQIHNQNKKTGLSSDLTPAANVTASVGGMKKSAQSVFGGLSSGTSSPSSATTGWAGSAGNSVRQINQVYSPLWLDSNLNLPRDRATINAWCRSFFALNPIVQNAINLHSTYPISKLNIKCHNKQVEKFFNEMVEEIDLINICIQAAQEYWLLGEVFIYAEIDPAINKWSRLVIQNPDYIVVKKSVLASEPVIMLRPDDNLRRICMSNKPADIEQRRTLNEDIIRHVRRGENIPLNNFYVSHLSRKIAPYEIRGTGLPVSCFRQLMLLDLLRECKFSQANNLVNPITVVKIGSAEYKPTQSDLEAWRQTFESAQFDRDFKIFTHEGVAIERVGANSAILDTSSDITQLWKEIYAGLMIPQIIIEGGGDITYANGGVSLDVLRQRYMSFRAKMEHFIKYKLFMPIAKLNDFYEFKDGAKTLIIPEIEWNHMSIFDAMDYINVLMQLTGESPRVSLHSLYRSLGLDYEDEQRKIRKEAVSTAIRKKEQAVLDAMSLNELRSLTEEDDINEPVSEEGAGKSEEPPPGTPGSELAGLPGLEPPPTGTPETPPTPPAAP